MQIPIFWEVVSTPYYETRALGNTAAFRNFSERKLTYYRWETTNKLLGCFQGLYGCKTGITSPAGPCFAGYYEKKGLKLALILLHSASQDQRWIEISRMVNWISTAYIHYSEFVRRQEI